MSIGSQIMMVTNHYSLSAPQKHHRTEGIVLPGMAHSTTSDTAGQHTWVLNICGHKFWLLFTLKEEYAHGSEEEQNTALLNIFKSDKMLIEDALGSVPENFSTPLPFEAYVDIHLVVIEPGSLLHVFISDLSH